MSRRPSITIYDYPEDLNPFKDDNEEVGDKLSENGVVVRAREREDKKKFWTFGRKKKRSSSFSLKSKWNGIFGKKKESSDRSPTISTVSSTYQRASYNNPPIPPPRTSKDQQEFDEALGTLARRRKYTFDNSSRYSSSLTMNGDPGRIYDGFPQDTTVSIMGDLTPKPPARRFGQVSPKPTDKIPPLDYGHKSDDRDDDETPIPPKRGGFRASQRLTIPQEPEDDKVQMRNGSFTDENENMPGDYVFRRCSNDAVRKSNLSINSCISVNSVYASGRKKRRAPLPPGKKPEPLEIPQENHVTSLQEIPPDPLEISRVAEDITEMTKKTQQIDDLPKEIPKTLNSEDEISENSPEKSQTIPESSSDHQSSPQTEESQSKNENSQEEKIKVEIEFTRTPEKPLEIIKDISIIPDDNDDVIMRDKTSNLYRSDSFSVKEEIEKIEKQIKLLESKKLRTRTTSFTSSLDNDDDHLPQLQRGGSRRSLQETRKNFFRDLTKNGTADDIKIEIRELPREQKEIKIVRLPDPPVADDGSKDAVKIIELHISEPIKQKAEFPDLDINPIPKPRRHASRGPSEEKMNVKNEEENYGNLV